MSSPTERETCINEDCITDDPDGDSGATDGGHDSCKQTITGWSGSQGGREVAWGDVVRRRGKEGSYRRKVQGGIGAVKGSSHVVLYVVE